MPAQVFAAPCPARVPALARMLQFGDSMLPVGAFAFSGGLESAVQHKVVHNAVTLHDFTLTALEQAARGDAVALACAMRAAAAQDMDALLRADREVLCRKLPEETRQMSLRMGKKLAELGVDVLDTASGAVMRRWLEIILTEKTPGTWPVSQGVLFAGLGLSVEQSIIVHQYGVAMTILNAALRLMRVTHLDTQRILFNLASEFEVQCTHAVAASLEQMSNYAPMTDILAAVHVKAHVRLFMN